MFGCTLGRCLQLTVAGGSYQEGLHATLQGVPPGMRVAEQGIYGDLLLRKPGADELSSPRKEPDIPIIYCGVNSADTVEDGGNKGLTNGTPLTILIPNLDRHFVHINEYQRTNRTPRPGHASYATFQKYGPADDAIGAGIFSGRYTCTIVAAGHVAKSVLARCGVHVFSYVTELAGVACPEVDHDTARQYCESYKQMRRDLDPFYQEMYVRGRMGEEMRLLEKMAVLRDVEQEIDPIRERAPRMEPEQVRERYGVHEVLNCPDITAAQAMVDECNRISATGDSAGGLVQVVALGLPAGLGEPVFDKLDAELGRMTGIGAVKAVEIGAGMAVKDMTGSQCNDEMRAEDGEVEFLSNNAGGITGGITTGQPVIVRLAVKPTPTIDMEQRTIDKYTLENTKLAAITRRDPTIVARIWPVAEAYTALVLLDHLTMHYGYEELKQRVGGASE
ncbi:MAG: chorismate synthase [Candidatus Brocadiia bacterium]